MKRIELVREILKSKKEKQVKPIFGDIDGTYTPDDDPTQPVWYVNTDKNER